MWKRETPPIVIERQRPGEMAFDVPERLLGWIFIADNFLEATPL
jgi:hypothetical protein